jgi:aspartate carbamoyltransferase catalytic subunit
MDAHRDEPATKKDLDQVKQELTDKIDVNGRKIDANSAKIDANGRKIDANSKKIDANSAKLDRIALQVVENREQIGEMVTRTEFNKRFDEVMRSLDALMAVFTRVDEERVATTAWIRRVESDVETNKSEIKKIKTKLTMDT